MKDILIVLLVIAVIILVFGVVNHDAKVDVDYVVGTWENVSLFTLAGIGAGVTFAVGLGAATVAGMRVVGDRRKLEKELEQVYSRLRKAEAAQQSEVAEDSTAASEADNQTSTADAASKGA